jgi:hypothetical protein
MSTVEELRQERTEIRKAYLSGQKPKRVLINATFSLESACGLAGIDIKKAHYSMELVEQALEKVCQTFRCDTMPARTSRFAYIHQLVGAKNWIMGSDGTLQHPEIAPMNPDEYDEFINAPYKTVVEKILPRICSSLEKDPISNGLTLTAAYGAFKNISGANMALNGKLSAKYGYVPGFINNQPFLAPFDFISDHLRGFTGINVDVRRIPDKVKAAAEVLVPLTMKMAVPPVMRPGICSFVPLHLGPYLNKKAFEELYWPTLEKIIVELDKIGISCALFAEHDWTSRASYLASLPKSSIVYMEMGDPKVFADTVGKDHVIGGFYDPTISLTRSKEECIDEAKRLLDIVMKTGKYYFCFDKSVLSIKSINVSKIQAVLEWIYENAKY